MKKLVFFILALTMFLSLLLTSCGGENESSSVFIPSDAVSNDASSDESSPDETSKETVNFPERPDGYPTVCGSFMQPGAFAKYNLKRMKEHLTYMREVGIDIIILQWSFETVGDKVGNVYYEDSFSSSEKGGTYNNGGKTLVETLLQAADELDMKVFLGLNNNDEWWQKAVNDKAWLTDQIELGMEGAKQIYDTYKEKYPNALHGWYFVFEYYNFKASSVQIDNAAYLLNGFLDGLKELDASMPLMLSPFVSSGNSTAVEAGDMWEKVFAKANFREGDIFCCQDSVGAGHISIDQLDDYYRELKEAVDKEKGLHFWANNEDFTQSNWTTAPLDRFVRQMNIAAKYVEAHVTFAYSHYQNPDLGKHGYHEAYKEYFNTGKIPESSLTAPTVEYTSEGGGMIVNFNGTIDNTSKQACRVHIKKNGEGFNSIDVTSKYNSKSIKFQLDDTNLEGSGVAKYEFYVEDYYGNFSEITTIEIEYRGKNGQNIALGKDYTLTKQPESGYPDESKKAFTDGERGTASYSEKAWVGFLGKPEIIIDLGEKSDGIYAFKINTLGGGAAGVFAPNSFQVFISDDGTNYTQVANRTFDVDSDAGAGTLVERTIFTSTESVSARYVKILVGTNQSWIFIDEIEIIAE